MASSYVRRAPLDTSWLNDSEHSEGYSENDNEDANTNRDSEPDVDNTMPLPPEDFYTTQEELFNDIQDWARQHKYAFRVGRWKYINKYRKKYTYFCTRCGPKPITDR
jgi:hypothetical protein